MALKQLSIGVFDSGVGGLTVLKSLLELLPHESFVYFGDTARLPYGNKSADQIIQYSFEAATFLQKKNIKMFIIACHTASVHALNLLKEHLPIPVIGTIEPAISEIFNISKTKRIAVLGTQSMIDSGVYQKLIPRHNPEAYVLPIACPKFVPLIEKGLVNHQMIKIAIHETLKILKTVEIDSILLASTHFPHIKEHIQNEVGPNINIIDPSTAVAKATKSYLSTYLMLNDQRESSVPLFYVSKEEKEFEKFTQSFFHNDLLETHLQQLEPLESSLLCTKK